MDMTPVDSSAVSAIGWEDGVMHIRYKSGETYAFAGVSEDDAEALKHAPSIGRELRNIGVPGVRL